MMFTRGNKSQQYRRTTLSDWRRALLKVCGHALSKYITAYFCPFCNTTWVLATASSYFPFPRILIYVGLPELNTTAPLLLCSARLAIKNQSEMDMSFTFLFTYKPLWLCVYKIACHLQEILRGRGLKRIPTFIHNSQIKQFLPHKLSTHLLL